MLELTITVQGETIEDIMESLAEVPVIVENEAGELPYSKGLVINYCEVDIDLIKYDY